MALDTLFIGREFADDADERRRAQRVCELIRKTLAGEVKVRDLVAQRRPQARLKAFRVEPRVVIDNVSSNRFTVIEVSGLDRIGLLYALTEALFRLNLNIVSAQITTFGERAMDVFYVTDLTGAKIVNADRHKAIERELLAAGARTRPGGGGSQLTHNFSDRSRKALPTTLTELSAIAAAAITGDSRSPNTGYSTPAATGTPKPL
jgi:[protein-PII] uridylyltransferase